MTVEPLISASTPVESSNALTGAGLDSTKAQISIASSLRTASISYYSFITGVELVSPTKTPLTLIAVSDTMLSIKPMGRPSSTVLTATVPLASAITTATGFFSGLSAIMSLTSFISVPSPRLPGSTQPGLPGTIKQTHDASINSANSASAALLTTEPLTSVLTLTLPTGIPPGNMTTLLTFAPTAMPIATPAVDPDTLLRNATLAVRVLELLITVLKTDEGVSVVTIPEIGTTTGSNDELAGLLRDTAVDLLS
ncbi:hypothetical protein MMC21_003096 [Puttea exsequens]|nr:hypothetical protein [Puttea exsequens]